MKLGADLDLFIMNSFVCGDYVSDSSCIYVVTKVEEEKDYKGVKRIFIHFRPILGTDKVFTAKIPQDNIIRTGLRRVLDSKEIEKLLLSIATFKDIKNYSLIKAKENVYRNEARAVARLLKYLWLNQVTLDRNSHELMHKVFRNLTTEIAFVTKKRTPSD